MIYDITQPLFECEVFPGDPKPEKKIMMRLEKGDVCNLTAFSMCAHNGTHVDAPFHFINDGKGIDKVALEKFIGPAYVKKHKGDVSASDAKEILKKAKAAYNGAEKKILNQIFNNYLLISKVVFPSLLSFRVIPNFAKSSLILSDNSQFFWLLAIFLISIIKSIKP